MGYALDGLHPSLGYVALSGLSLMSSVRGSGERLSKSLSPKRVSYVNIGCSPMFTYDTTGAEP